MPPPIGFGARTAAADPAGAFGLTNCVPERACEARVTLSRVIVFGDLISTAAIFRSDILPLKPREVPVSGRGA